MNVQRSAGASRSHAHRTGPRRGWRGPIRALLGLLVMASPGTVASQSAVEVSPPVLLHDGGQAAPVDAAFAVKNPTDLPLFVRVSLADWHYLADGTPNYLKAGSLPRTLAPYVTFNPAEFLLEPGETSEVCYTVESDISTPLTRELTYYSPDHEVVAIFIFNSDGEWGRCPTLEPAGSEPVLYPQDSQDPRCKMMECTPGVCD